MRTDTKENNPTTGDSVIPMGGDTTEDESHDPSESDTEISEISEVQCRKLRVLISNRDDIPRHEGSNIQLRNKIWHIMFASVVCKIVYTILALQSETGSVYKVFTAGLMWASTTTNFSILALLQDKILNVKEDVLELPLKFNWRSWLGFFILWKLLLIGLIFLVIILGIIADSSPIYILPAFVYGFGYPIGAYLSYGRGYWKWDK